MRVTINSRDAKLTWGIVFDSSAISALMTPAPMKDFIENSSRLEHGKRVITTNPKVSSRTLTISFSLYANDEETFFERYDSFCTELEKGTLDIVLSSRPLVKYRCIYKSCKPITQYRNRLAKFSLSLEEPNPKNRSL